MKTVIMAGGRGMRIREQFPEIPKPLIPIRGRPVLEWEIRVLREQGLRDLIVTVSHMADQVMRYFGDGERLGVHLEYVVEQEPLGTAGSLFGLRDRLGSEPFLLLNADTLFEVDLWRLVAFHREHQALVTLLVHPGDHLWDCSVIVPDPEGVVQELLTPEMERPEWMMNCVNVGLQVMDPVILDRWSGKRGGPVNLDRHILRPLCGTGEMRCLCTTEYVRDMGTPERYEQVCRDVENGITKARRLGSRKRAVFIDRDRLLAFRDGEKIELIPGTGEAVRQINVCGALVFAVAVSPGPAGFSETDIRNRLDTLLVRKGAFLDGTLVLPETGLVEILQRYNIDPARSWLIGTIAARANPGCRVARNWADWMASGLPEFARQRGPAE
ncbi:MAG: NTP transferase domain-containing protein [Clostridia bacterium]|nr:NTP transferase domain-containing protein [Clostridia bacterium]